MIDDQNQSRAKRFEQLKSLLRSNDLESYNAISELKDFLDRCYYFPEQGTYMAQIIPELLERFKNIPNQFEESKENTMRYNILEIIHKCPNIESMKNLSNQLFKAAVGVILHDNEENAILAIKIFIEFCRHFKDSINEMLIDQVQKFAEKLFRSSEEIIKSGINRRSGHMLQSSNSFKVLIECGNCMGVLYNIGLRRGAALKDLIIHAFEIVCRDDYNSYKRTPFYKDYLFFKTKILTFLTQFSQSPNFKDDFKQKECPLANAIISLMKELPPDHYNLKKDLLQGFSVIIKSNIKQGFVNYIDTIMNEGESFNSIRSTWYSFILEFIDTFKQEMNIVQLCNATAFICRNIHLYLQYHLHSLSILRSILENIRTDKTNIRTSRDRNAQIIELIYQIILLMISERLQYCYTSIEESIPHLKQSRSSPSTVNKNSLNVHESSAVHKRLMELSKGVISEKLCLTGPGSSQGGILQDQETLFYISKIFRYSILYAKIYPSMSAEREEVQTYDNISQLLISFHPTTLHDLLQDLVPFLFVRYIESQKIYRLFEALRKPPKENQRAMNDVVMSFVIENLEILEQDSPMGESRLIELYERAGIKPSGSVERVHIRRCLWNFVEMILSRDVLEVHGVRFIKKCEELSKNDNNSKFVHLAKNCISLAFKYKGLRNLLSTTWIQRQEPILQANPPYHVVYQHLCTRVPDKLNQACMVIYENLDKLPITPQLVKKLYNLLLNQNSPYTTEVMCILGKMGPAIRQMRQAVALKSWDSLPTTHFQYPYNFPFPVISDSEGHEVYIPMEYIISKIAKCFKSKNSQDPKNQKALKSAYKIVANCALCYLNKIQLDTKIIIEKVNGLFNGGCSPLTPVVLPFPELQQKSIRNGLIFTLEAIISLISVEESEETLKEIYKILCTHIGLLCFASVEGTYIDFGFNTNDLIEVICDKLALKEKENDRFLVALQGLNHILNAISSLLQKNSEALSRSVAVKNVLMCLVRTCHKADWNLQARTAGGIVRLLKIFPESLIRANANLILSTALHVIQCKSSGSKSQLLEEPVKLCNVMLEYISADEQLRHLSNSLFSPSFHVREIARKYLKERNLLTELQTRKLHIVNVHDTFYLPDLLLNKNLYTEKYRRSPMLELLSFALREALIKFDSGSILQLIEIMEMIVQDAKEKYDAIEYRSSSRRGAAAANKDQEFVSEVERYEKLATYQLMKDFISYEDMIRVAKAHEGKLETLKTAISFSFLRAISYTEEEDCISIVKSGIEIILQRECNNNNRQILPQDELKVCLRPILAELAHQLSLPSLSTLRNFSRLLEVIPNCFNKNVGEKIIKHLHDASSEHSKDKLPFIIANINLLPLLPDCISEILETVVASFIKAEETLQRNSVMGYLNSPFYVPLIKFLVKYPEETKKFFFEEKYNDKKFIDYFVMLLGHPMAFLLRELVLNNYDIVIAKFLISDSIEQVYQGMKILHNLIQNVPKWISTKEDLVSCLREIWKKQQKQVIENEEDIIKFSFLEKYLIESFISFLRYNQSKTSLSKLLELPSSFTRKNIWNSEFLTSFLNKELPYLLSPEQKIDLMNIVIDYLNDIERSDNDKYKLIEHLVIPFLTETFKQDEISKIITKKLQNFTIRLIRKHLNDYSNIFCVQLMNLGSLFIENMKEEFFHHRKELIKFFWGMIKSENPFIKGNAYVNVARFINIYSLPDTLTVQLLGALLKAHHSELSSSAYQAFNYLSDKLINLFRDVRFRDHLSDFVNRNLQSETRSATSMMHVIEIIIKNADVFYHIRDKLPSHFFNWINQLGLGLHSNFHAKRTLLDLTNLMISWSEKHAEENNPEPFIFSSHREMLINFFARFGQAPALYISRTPHKNPEHMTYLSIKCVNNMKYALKLWDDVNFKAKNWTEALKKCVNLVQQQQPQPQREPTDNFKKLLERSLQIIKILAEHSTYKDIIQFPELIKYIALQVKSIEIPSLIKFLCEILTILLRHSSTELLSQLSEILEFAMKETQQNFLWCLSILDVISDFSYSDTSGHIKGLLNMTTAIIRDLVQQNDSRENKLKTLETGLAIIKKNLGHIADEHKRQLRQIILSIFDNYIETNIVLETVEIVDKWIYRESEDFELEYREQCELLLKLFRNGKLKIEHAEKPLDLAAKVLSSCSNCYEPKQDLLKAILIFLLNDPCHPLKPEFDRIFKETYGPFVWRTLLLIFDDFSQVEARDWTKLSVDFLLLLLEEFRIEDIEDYDLDMDIDGDREAIEYIRNHLYHSWNMYSHSLNATSKLIAPLREWLNSPFSHYIFVNLFPQLWAMLSRTRQETLSLTIEEFFLKRGPIDNYSQNPSKTVLIALSGCMPIPIIRPETLQFVAKTQNCWGIVVPILETYATHIPHVFGPNNYLSKLFDRLNEEELSTGWKLVFAKDPQVLQALSASLTKDWAASRILFEQVVQSGALETEMLVLEKERTNCLYKLGDWEELSKYSERRQDLSSVESLWQTNKYPELLALIKKLGLGGTPQFCYMSVLSELKVTSDSSVRMKDLEAKLEAMNSGILREWVALPKYPAKVHTHFINFLELKQELTECITLSRKLEEHKQVLLHEHSDLLETWNEKPVAYGENPSFLFSCFKARDVMLAKMKTMYARYQPSITTENPSFALKTPGIVSQVKVFRRNGLVNQAVALIKENTEVPIGNPEMTMELVKLSVANAELETALYILNARMQETSDNQFKAELLRLKGKICHRKLQEDPTCYYAEACNVAPDVPKNWLVFGEFLTDRWRETQDKELLVDAVLCLIHGLYDNPDRSAVYMPVIFKLLEKTQFESVKEEIDKIPLEHLSEFTCELLKSVEVNPECFSFLLNKLAENSPQELFFFLRNAVIKSREDHSREVHSIYNSILSTMMETHPILCSTLEYLAGSLATCFKATAEEDLHSALLTIFSYPSGLTYEETKEIMQLTIDKFFSAPELSMVLQDIKSPFLEDFSETTLADPTLFRETVKRWKDYLHSLIKQNSTEYLDEKSQDLGSLLFKDLHIPGTRNSVKLERMLPHISNWIHKNCNRVVSMKGVDGVEYSFLVLVTSPGSNEHYLRFKLTSGFNSLFDFNIKALKHRIFGSEHAVHTVVPLDPRHSLVAIDPKTITFKEIYDLWVKSYEQDPDLSPCEIPSNSLRSYIQLSLQSPERYLKFQSQFTAQYALLYFFTRVFGVSLQFQTLDKFFFSRSTGNFNFPLFEVPFFSGDNEKVRMTENIKQLIGQGGLNGLMPAVIHGTASCLMKKPLLFSYLVGYIMSDYSEEDILKVQERVQECLDIAKIRELLNEESVFEYPTWVKEF